MERRQEIFIFFFLLTFQVANSLPRHLPVAFTPKRSPRIVSGTNAKPHEFPFVVSLVWSAHGGLLCGGSIYNEKTIITAAHCVMEEKEAPFSILHFIFTPAPKFVVIPRKRLLVVAGENHLYKVDGTEQFRTLAKITIHPQYVGSREPHDVAVLILEKPLIFNKNVKAVPLAPKGYLPLGFGTIVGWGVDGEGRTSKVLKKGRVPLLPEVVCSLSFSDFRLLSNICAGGTKQDTCFGDSGGPLLCDDPPLLCGITSYGSGCGKLLRPGAYTKVTYFYDWIVQNAAKCGEDCDPAKKNTTMKNAKENFQPFQTFVE